MLTWTDEWNFSATVHITPHSRSSKNTIFLAIRLSVPPHSEWGVTLVRPLPTNSGQTNPRVGLINHVHDCLLLLLVSHAGQVCVSLPAVTLSWEPGHRNRNCNVLIGRLWNKTIHFDYIQSYSFTRGSTHSIVKWVTWSLKQRHQN